eukprot:5668225-Prymnesium_polylepis.1
MASQARAAQRACGAAHVRHSACGAARAAQRVWRSALDVLDVGHARAEVLLERARRLGARRAAHHRRRPQVPR